MFLNWDKNSVFALNKEIFLQLFCSKEMLFKS